MTKRNINKYLESRWEARFLINTIMGLLATQRGVYADAVSYTHLTLPTNREV